MADVTRQEYRELSDEEKARIKELKATGTEFISQCNAAGKSRELSLAITKMEEAVMWAVKGITG